MNPTIIARAPVRISFGGGGTDLEAYYRRFGGLVLSSAINRYCAVTASPSPEGDTVITSDDYGVTGRWSAGTRPALEEPLVLPKAVLALFHERGWDARGVHLSLRSDVPPGTGLGSSSAMTVALIGALAAYLGVSLPPYEIAHLACQVEIDRLNMPIGKQDQFASAMGGVNLLHFRPDRVDVKPVELSTSLHSRLSKHLLLFSTGQSRHSSSILREQRSRTNTQRGVTDSLHQLKELAREMAQVLRQGDLDSFGLLLDRGWQYKKQLSGRISSAAIDEWYDMARNAGALGGKITGAGGGGFLLLYVPPDRRTEVQAAMSGAGLQEMPFTLEEQGICVTEQRTASGNRVQDQATTDREFAGIAGDRGNTALDKEVQRA